MDNIFKFLGRGSAFNKNENNTSAYFILDKSLYLIDCGETVFKKILNLGLLNKVKTVNIFITHLHPDHVGSLGSLIFFCKYKRCIKPNIYYNSPDIYDLLSLNGVNHNMYKRYLNILDKQIKIDDNVSIKTILTEHCKELGSYSYLFSINDKNIYYSGDTNQIPKKIINMLEDNQLDKIYQDTCLADYSGNVHLSLNKLSELIKESYRDKVCCMHIDSEYCAIKAKKFGFNVVEVE